MSNNFSFLGEKDNRLMAFQKGVRDATESAMIELTKKAQAAERARLELQFKTLGIDPNSHQAIEEIYKQQLRHESEISRLRSATTEQLKQKAIEINKNLFSEDDQP